MAHILALTSRLLCHLQRETFILLDSSVGSRSGNTGEDDLGRDPLQSHTIAVIACTCKCWPWTRAPCRNRPHRDHLEQRVRSV